MELPLISFIVPCYNVEKTIRDCVHSINLCDYPINKKEIIAVNNNSTDLTLKILTEISQEISIKIINETNQGRSYARNTGAQLASGEVLAFIDADCKINQNWAKAIGEKFLSKQIGAAQGPIIPIPDDTDNLLSKFRYYQSARSTGGTHTLIDVVTPKFPMINSATCAYQKSIFEQVGGFDVALERHEDIDLSRRVFNAGPIVASCPEAISEVYWHGEGWKDFFERAIAHGRTLVDYEKKWGKKENPLKLVYYIFCSKLMNLFRKNNVKTNYFYEVIDHALTSISFISFTFFWFFRNYQGKNSLRNQSNIDLSKDLFLTYTREDISETLYFPASVNFAFLTDKAFVKNINKNLIVQFEDIYYFFLKEISNGVNDSQELFIRCEEEYDIGPAKINFFIEQFFSTLKKHQLLLIA